MTNRYKLLPLLLSLGLAACGGGGGGDGTPSTAPAVSTPDITARSAMMWRATTSTGRSGRFVLLDGGRFYFLYSAMNRPTVLGGAVTAVASLSAANTITSTAADFNWEGLPGALTTLSASLDAQSNLNGSLSYDDTSRNLSFTSIYEAPTASMVSLGDVAGTYVNGDRSMTLVLSASGALSGTAFSSSCRFTGAAKQTLNYTSLLHLSLTFQGGDCAFGTSTVTGIAAYDASQRQLVGIALDSTGTSASLFQAAKP